MMGSFHFPPITYSASRIEEIILPQSSFVCMGAVRGADGINCCCLIDYPFGYYYPKGNRYLLDSKGK
jgi:hypothetical protein